MLLRDILMTGGRWPTTLTLVHDILTFSVGVFTASAAGAGTAGAFTAGIVTAGIVTAGGFFTMLLSDILLAGGRGLTTLTLVHDILTFSVGVVIAGAAGAGTVTAGIVTAGIVTVGGFFTLLLRDILLAGGRGPTTLTQVHDILTFSVGVFTASAAGAGTAGAFTAGIVTAGIVTAGGFFTMLLSDILLAGGRGPTTLTLVHDILTFSVGVFTASAAGAGTAGAFTAGIVTAGIVTAGRFFTMLLRDILLAGGRG